MNPAVVSALLLLTLPITAQADTLASLEVEARNLLAQGQSLDRTAGGACIQKMRVLRPQVERLQSRIEALPRTSADHLYLGLAANYLQLCVSCSERPGPEHCNEAASYLRKMESRR